MSRCQVGNHTWERIPCFALAYVFLVLPCAGFLPNFWSRVLTLSWSTHTHQYMTEKAILNVTLETMKAIDRNAEEQRLGRGFWQAVGEVVKSNAAMDFLSSTRSDPVYHFDSERVDSAIIILRQFWAQTVLSVRAKEFQSARRTLGQLFHSLQDFYSHSNWVEMGQRTIYSHLLHPDEHAFPVANDDTPTCLECFSATCRDNLLPRLVNEQPPLLTTGYFSSYPSKPEGKCSHGGILDSSRRKAAKGGINKDSTSPIFSPHHYLHVEAARLAADATLTVLRDLRDTVGLESFLRLFSVTQPPALVFVMDTTGSMFEEITAARLRALSIIQRRANTSPQPGTFLLVPFHDPGVGPVYETGDPDQFMGYMENLMALGGGDEPEMCLSAIQLALTHSPPLSEVFVFTDASPKDAHLYSAVKALALEKQCKVTFLLTEEPRHKRESRRRRVALSPDRFSLYYSLSSISGGLTVFTTKSDIYKVSAIVEDITSAHKVTLLHVETDNDSTTRFFRVDSAVKTVTLHLTGNLIDCSLINPSGQSQSLLSEEGPLAELVHFDGLYRIHLLSPIQRGLWSLQAKTDGHLTFNIIGDSSVDFLYYFATVSNKTHPGLARVEGSPIAGVATFLVLVVTGLADNEEVLFSHVTLLGANGESLQQVLLNSSSPSSTSSYTGEELVGRVCSVPPVPFCVCLSGQDGQGNKLERVSTEMIQPTQVQIQVLIVPNLVAGYTSAVHFKVLNHGPARVINLSAVDDYGYLHQRGSHSVPVAERGSVEDQVDLHTPATAEAGRTVTLTVTVHAMDSSDSNYAVVYLTVVPQDPDLSPPSCTIEQVEHPCPPRQLRCSTSSWSVSLAVSDRRSGLSSLQLNQGDGALTLLHGPLYPGRPGDAQTNQQPSDEGGVTAGSIGALEKGDRPVYVSDWVGASSQLLWLRYTSSCCSSSAELLVWDKAGNMKRCHVTSGQQRAMKDMSAESETSGSVNTSPTNCFCMLLGLLWTCLP